MVRKEENRRYVGIEKGLQVANQRYISVNQKEMNKKRHIVEAIIVYLVDLMREESETFNHLYVQIFGGGSGYEGLKITDPDEFDIDILLKIPRFLCPDLKENNIPGYVNLKLENLQCLKNDSVYSKLETWVDESGYLLTDKLKAFMQSIFDRVMDSISNNTVLVNNRRFIITRVQNLGPAFTLTIVGPKKFNVSVDLVPCIMLEGYHWLGEGFRSNPYSSPSDFFIVPKSPKRDIPHIQRYWRLSFQKQEREMIFDQQFLKPTIRILKRIRDNLGHKISSYAIKTMFFKEVGNSIGDEEISELWLSPLSNCVVCMLRAYSDYLDKKKIPYFWNKKLNLIEDLSEEQLSRYKLQIDMVVQDLTNNSSSETVLSYLR